MDIIPEIDLSREQHDAIRTLRNSSFPEHQAERSYFKQLPHMRALEYQDKQLLGHMGLDYRVISAGGEAYKVLGVIDFCVKKAFRGRGIGSAMLSQLSSFAENKDVDFIILISELKDFYASQGYLRISGINSWLRLHNYTNYGVAVEYVDELHIKSIRGKAWAGGHVDWLGYMF